MKHLRGKHNESLIIATFNDVHTLICLVAWPFSTLERALERTVRHELRLHPKIKPWMNRHVFAIAIGLLFLLVAFLTEDWSHHVSWKVTTETMKAAGVCPIWEVLANFIKVR